MLVEARTGLKPSAIPRRSTNTVPVPRDAAEPRRAENRRPASAPRGGASSECKGARAGAPSSALKPSLPARPPATMVLHAADGEQSRARRSSESVSSSVSAGPRGRRAPSRSPVRSRQAGASPGARAASRKLGATRSMPVSPKLGPNPGPSVGATHSRHASAGGTADISAAAVRRSAFAARPASARDSARGRAHVGALAAGAPTSGSAVFHRPRQSSLGSARCSSVGLSPRGGGHAWAHGRVGGDGDRYETSSMTDAHVPRSTALGLRSSTLGPRRLSSPSPRSSPPMAACRAAWEDEFALSAVSSPRLRDSPTAPRYALNAALGRRNRRSSASIGAASGADDGDDDDMRPIGRAPSITTVSSADGSARAGSRPPHDSERAGAPTSAAAASERAAGEGVDSLFGADALLRRLGETAGSFGLDLSLFGLTSARAPSAPLVSQPAAAGVPPPPAASASAPPPPAAQPPPLRLPVREITAQAAPTTAEVNGRDSASDSDDGFYSPVSRVPVAPANPNLARVPGGLRLGGGDRAAVTLPPPISVLAGELASHALAASADAPTPPPPAPMLPGFKLDMAKVAAGRIAITADKPDEAVPYTPLGKVVERLERERAEAARASSHSGPPAPPAPPAPLSRAQSLRLDLGAVVASHARAETGKRPSPLFSAPHERPNWVVDFSELRLGRRIGSGAFGEVYEAEWRRDRIAVKQSIFQSLDQKHVQLLKDEMEIMSNLRHKHIVHFLGACVEVDQMAILFEHCRCSLLSLLHDERFALDAQIAVQLSKQVALGMFYLHQCKPPVLHLDLKAANVLIDRHGVAKVCDFGLSHIKREAAIVTSRIGSAQWTAPEVLKGEPHDESADIYSFGFFLLEVATRELPYRGLDSYQVVMGVITRLLPRPTPPVSDLAPAQLVSLMERCWAEGKDERPRFDAILDTLDELVAQVGAPEEDGVLRAMPPPSERDGGGAALRPLPPLPLPPSRGADNVDAASSRAADGARASAAGAAGGDRARAGATRFGASLDARDDSFVIAHFDYAAKRPDELSFQRDARIGVLGPAPTKGWWRGRLNGRSGLFPENYVTFEGGWASSSGRDRSARLSEYAERSGGRALAGGAATAVARSATDGAAAPGGRAAEAFVQIERGPLESFLELPEPYMPSRPHSASGSGGGAAHTVRARDLLSHALVQVKLVPTGASGRVGAADARARALAEAKLLHMLAPGDAEGGLPAPPSWFQQLRYVVETPDSSTVALVLELLSGGDLFDRIEASGPLDEKDARRVTLQLLRALEQLHNRQIVHGNLVPTSVLFASAADGAPIRLTDLSEARQMRRVGQGREVEKLRGLCGTPDYAAPEVLSWLRADADDDDAGANGARRASRGPQPYGTAVDMWSLGVLVYIMLSGFPPFFGDDETELLARIASAEYSFPSSLAHDDVPGGAADSAARGAPSADVPSLPTMWPRVSPLAKDFISALLVADPAERMSVHAALAHSWICASYDERAVQLSVGQLRTRADNTWEGLKGAAATVRSSTPPRAARGRPVSASARAPANVPPARAAAAAANTARPASAASAAGAAGRHKPPAIPGGRGRMGWSLKQGPGLTNQFSRWLVSRVLGGKQLRLLVLGLDSAGKSSFCSRLKHGKPRPTMPTIGVHSESVEFGGTTFSVFDLSGQQKVRPLWAQQYADSSTPTHGVVFVLDSTDRARLPIVRDELNRLARATQLAGAAFVVFANKQDLPGALTVEQISRELGLEQMLARLEHHVQAGSVLTGEGVLESLEWLVAHAEATSARVRR